MEKNKNFISEFSHLPKSRPNMNIHGNQIIQFIHISAKVFNCEFMWGLKLHTAAGCRSTWYFCMSIPKSTQKTQIRNPFSVKAGKTFSDRSSLHIHTWILKELNIPFRLSAIPCIFHRAQKSTNLFLSCPMEIKFWRLLKLFHFETKKRKKKRFQLLISWIQEFAGKKLVLSWHLDNWNLTHLFFELYL